MTIHKLFMVLSTVLIFAQSSACGQASVSLDYVDGVVGGNKVLTDRKVVFHIRLQNATGVTVNGVQQGFEVSSLDGARWEPWIRVDTIIDFPSGTTFDTTFYVQWIDPEGSNLTWCCHDSDAIFFEIGTVRPPGPGVGTGSDTVGLYGYGIDPIVGIPDGFSEIAWTVSLDRIAATEVGKQICLDSCLYRNGPNPVPILWVSDTGIVYPMWDGPHCFTITDKCCWGMRGNVNLDWQDQIDISDLTALVGWMFKSGSAPPCMLEADVDGNGGHDLADVTYLVGYMFKSGPEPAGCP